jgi:SAM-dependent methyltransferase
MPTPPTAALSVRDGYAAWASLYDDDGNPLIALEGPAVRNWFGPLDGRRVLDVGCGTGRHTEALLDAGARRVVALDVTPAMIARARAKLVGRPVDWLLHALPAPLPFDDETFDLAVLGLVAEHIAALEPALVAVARVLVPGGRCILSALHPERTAAGQCARYIDPVTGVRRSIETYHRSVAEYHAAARAAGLSFVAERTLTGTEELARTHPRALPYVGLNLGWAVCWRKPVGTPLTRIRKSR